MITAKLIDIGRNKINRTVTVKTASALHKEIGKHILSKGWWLEETDSPNILAVTAGMRTVGKVEIIEQ